MNLKSEQEAARTIFVNNSAFELPISCTESGHSTTGMIGLTKKYFSVF